MNIIIQKKVIGPDHPCFFIAEAGVNHNGNLENAISMIDVAIKAGADAIKFQTFIAENLMTRDAPKADYALNETNPKEKFFEMIKKLELSLPQFRKLKEVCELKGIIFLSTPFSIEAVDWLVDLDVPAFKISSGDLDNYPLLSYVIEKKKPIILSSGMADMPEVQETLNFIKKKHFSELVLMHCTSSYPTEFRDANLNVLDTYRTQFPNIVIGFSDHTPGTIMGAVAIAKGAKVIEKHFTLDKSMEGPDHKASLDPVELEDYIKNIRLAELAMGDPHKKITKAEENVRMVARKSIVSRIDLPKGTVLSLKHITVKRPGTGIPAKKIDDVLGRVINKDIKADTIISWNDLV